MAAFSTSSAYYTELAALWFKLWWI